MTTKTGILVLSSVLLGVLLPGHARVSSHSMPGQGPSASSATQAPAEAGKESILRISGKLRILTLEGSSYEMGLAHGRALRKEIREIVGRWREDLESDLQTDAAPSSRPSWPGRISGRRSKSGHRDSWTRSAASPTGPVSTSRRCTPISSSTRPGSSDRTRLDKCTSIGARKAAGRSRVRLSDSRHSRGTTTDTRRSSASGTGRPTWNRSS